MSGIVGVFNRNGEPVRRKTIISMSDAINHRGPHDRGVWTDGPVGFGHVLLHTTEASIRERQPFSLDGRSWITADARIDDREGLIDLLKSRVDHSETLKEATDVALLLHAYLAWGVECVHHLTGVFAAAIWDGRERQLVCLRDQIGIKPFYYAETADRFVFASEVKGILASGLVPQRIYEPRIADFLVDLEGIDKTCSFFQGVVRLPPAHRMVCCQYRLKVEEYWALDPNREIRFINQGDYVEAFREQFYKAVQCRLRGSGQVASMLSGGLDSSSIVAVARDILSKQSKPNLQTYSVVNSRDPDCRETYFTNQVLAQGQLASNKIEVEDLEKYRNALDEILHSTDDPFDIGMYVPQLMYIAARQNGVTVLLDGVDGDLVMGQPGNHIAYLLQRFRVISAFSEARSTRRFYYRFPQTVHSHFFTAIRQAFTPSFLRYARQRWREFRSVQTLQNQMKETIINRDFANRICLSERIKSVQPCMKHNSRINLRVNQADALNHPHIVAALERYDRVASRYGVEPRHPILDRRLMEFCLALPWEQKIKAGWTKMIARRSMTGLLPEEVIWRKGFEHLGPQVTAQLYSQEMISAKRNVNEEIDDILQYVNAEEIKKAYGLGGGEGKAADPEEFWKIVDARALLSWKKRWE